MGDRHICFMGPTTSQVHVEEVALDVPIEMSRSFEINAAGLGVLEEF